MLQQLLKLSAVSSILLLGLSALSQIEDSAKKSANTTEQKNKKSSVRELDKWNKEIVGKLSILKQKNGDELEKLVLLLQADKPKVNTISLLADMEIDAAKVEKLIAEISNWEKNLKLVDAKGQTENRLLRAEAFSQERQYRRALAAQVSAMTSHVEKLRLIHQLELLRSRNKVSELQKLIKKEREEVLAKLTKAPVVAGESGNSIKLSDIESFEYHTVLKAGTVQKISALAEVYGTPDKWELLMEANSDIIKDKDMIIPVGTQLTLPIFKVKADDRDKEE